ncbi:MAG: hypothetical protein HC835_22085 [Oscillatoriales cyanobacterium RM2_1_1]|nr:hypothetical protein [Oscillatoriales cyanobacterium SM2_3_0]NJO48063.1 hypothetical protein [Oscillatoriales cyanobacterium RM2_1_1]
MSILEFVANLQGSLERSPADDNSPGSIATVLTADGQLWIGATGRVDVENTVPDTVESHVNAENK